MYEIKTEGVSEDFSVIIQLSQNFMIIQTNKWLVKRKMKQMVLQLKNLLV